MGGFEGVLRVYRRNVVQKDSSCHDEWYDLFVRKSKVAEVSQGSGRRKKKYILDRRNKPFVCVEQELTEIDQPIH